MHTEHRVLETLGVDFARVPVVTRDQVRRAKPAPIYGEDELQKAGAYRVYEDPADLLRHIDEVGGRR